MKLPTRADLSAATLPLSQYAVGANFLFLDGKVRYIKGTTDAGRCRANDRETKNTTCGQVMEFNA